MGILTADKVIRHGYFPRELPPTFTTEKLAALLERNPDAVSRDGGKTECVRHNFARAGGFRRPLRVPNPRSFVRLADEFESQWPTIRAHFRSTRFAISQPVAMPTATLALSRERAIRPRYRIGERERLRPQDWRGQRFVLRTDINQFYPSLYTHSIPWALEGKQVAKQNLGKTESDKLDKAFRNLSDGQTMGVPIGPDTSFLAAEIVMAAVDKALAARLGTLKGHRYIDDFELAFSSRSAAEEALALLEDELAEYELAINVGKTEILQLPQPFHEGWRHELSTFPVREEGTSPMIKDLLALFSHAASAAQIRPGPLKYALLRSRSVHMENDRVWKPFQNLVWSAVSAEPTTMATALDVLAEKAKDGKFKIDPEALSEVVEALISTHSPVRNASEVAWGLWAAISNNVGLSSDAASAVAAMDDDFVALLALDADSRGLFPSGALDTSGWEAATDYDGVLSGPHWLLAYEGAVRGWLDAPKARIGKDPFFKRLRARKVRFYDPNPPSNPFSGPAGPLPGGLVPDDYV